MKKISLVFVITAIVLSFCFSAMAEKPTQDQYVELNKLVEICELDISTIEPCIEVLLATAFTEFAWNDTYAMRLNRLVKVCKTDRLTAKSCIEALRVATASVFSVAPKPERCATVTIDYDLDFATISEGYDWTYRVIKDGYFQVRPRGIGKVTRELCWFKFYGSVSRENAQARIEAGGEFLVGDLWELRALGKAKTYILPLVALGSEQYYPCGRVYCLFLVEDDDARPFGGQQWLGPDGRCGNYISDGRFPCDHTYCPFLSENNTLNLTSSNSDSMWYPGYSFVAVRK